MSQIDIASGSPGERIRKGGIVAPQVPDGPSVGLVAPGVTPGIPNTTSVSLLGQLLTSLDAAGGAAIAYAHDQNQKAAHAEHIARVQAQQADAMKAVAEGQAVEHANEDAPGLLDAVKQGQHIPDSNQSPLDYARKWSESQTAGWGSDKAAKYKSKMVPLLTDAITDWQAKDRDRLSKDAVFTIGSAASGADSVDAIAGYVARAKKLRPNDTEAQLLAAVVMPGAEAAARAGDSERLAMFTAALGGKFPDETVKLESVAAGVKAQNEAKDRQGADDYMAAAINEDPIAVATGKVDSLAKTFGEEWAGRWRAGIKTKADDLQREAAANYKQVAIAQWRSNIARDDDAAFESGSGFQIEAGKLDDEKGQTIDSATKAERQDAAFWRAASRRANSGMSQADLQSSIIQLAGKNDYSVPQWARSLNATATSITTNAMNGVDLIPDSAIESLKLAREIDKQAPLLLGKMLQGDAEKVIRLAMKISDVQGVPGGSPESDRMALSTAAKQVANRSHYDEPSRDSVQKAAVAVGTHWGPFNDSKWKNLGTVQSWITETATLFAPTQGADAAVESAAKIIKARIVDVDGYAVRGDQASVPERMRPALPAMLSGFVGEWKEKYAAKEASEGVHPVYNLSSDTWQLVDNHGQRVGSYGNPQSTTLSTADLIAHYTTAEAGKERTRWQREVDAILNPQPRRQPDTSGRRRPGEF